MGIQIYRNKFLPRQKSHFFLSVLALADKVKADKVTWYLLLVESGRYPMELSEVRESCPRLLSYTKNKKNIPRKKIFLQMLSYADVILRMTRE